MSSKNVQWAIEAESLGKCYELFENPTDRLKQLLWGSVKNYGRKFWALQDVNLQIGQGEVVGLVGRNGAGKSTLLQMLCGTLPHTAGHLKVNGRVAALLELGAGFNPEFTGIENVYMNGALMGLTHAQVTEKLPEIWPLPTLATLCASPLKPIPAACSCAWLLLLPPVWSPISWWWTRPCRWAMAPLPENRLSGSCA